MEDGKVKVESKGTKLTTADTLNRQSAIGMTTSRSFIEQSTDVGLFGFHQDPAGNTSEHNRVSLLDMTGSVEPVSHSG